MTNTKPDLKEIVYEHGFDQILDAELVDLNDLAVDYNIDLSAINLENSNAAQSVINEFSTQPAETSKGPFARSLEKQTLTHEDKVSLLERLIQTAKKLGLSCTFSLKDIVYFDDVALDFHIAEFQSLLDETEQKRNS